MSDDYKVTVNVPQDLTVFTDEYLVSLWHLAQINPAPFGDPEACRFTEKVGREIIRRFIAQVGPELWNNQGAHIGFEKRIENGVHQADNRLVAHQVETQGGE